MALFIIFTCLFIVSPILSVLSIYTDWSYKWFLAFIILFFISGLGIIVSSAFVKPDKKAIEYPASEYTFKIKVVEFEQQRDTILVVIPKEK